VPLSTDLGRAFLYARYNVDLSAEGLAALGFSTDEVDPAIAQRMDPGRSRAHRPAAEDRREGGQTGRRSSLSGRSSDLRSTRHDLPLRLHEVTHEPATEVPEAAQVKLCWPSRLHWTPAGFSYRKWGTTQTCRRGDWLVDNGGDVYTVNRDSFARTYRRIAPGRYLKITPVWAERPPRRAKSHKGRRHALPGGRLPRVQREVRRRRVRRHRNEVPQDVRRVSGSKRA
jgi:hypothetical protein